MKIYNAVLLLSVMLILIVVSSCSPSNEGLVTPTSTISVLATSTKMPTHTFAPLPPNTPTPVSTPTMVPTLPVDQAQARFLQLLSNNGECRLPCIWGITPGETTYQDARAILSPLSSLSDTVHLDTPVVGDISLRYREGDLEIYTRVAFLTDPESHIVNRVGFNTEAHRPLDESGYEDILDSKFFGAKIRAYTLPKILSELGIPESVMISTLGAPFTRSGTGGFELLLLYPNQGILINYTTQMALDGKKVRGCLTNAHVQMDLHPPGEPASFSKSLQETDWAVKLDGYKPIEEVTSMSVQEFYETYRTSTDKCIETPAEDWPIPEP